MRNGLISIITATFNSETTIRRTIESILNQTYTNLEYIIVDGASTDNTLKIIKSYQELFSKKNIKYKFISEKDTGIYNAFNKGIDLAEGNYISFLGSDDYYLKTAIDNYSKVFINSTYDLIYSNVDVILKDEFVKKKITGVWSWSTFKRYMNIAHVGSLHHKSFFNKYGKFDESYKIAGDYELLLRAGEELKVCKIEETTVKMLDGGVSHKNIYKVLKETRRAKVQTAKVNIIIVYLDFTIALLKFYIKRAK